MSDREHRPPGSDYEAEAETRSVTPIEHARRAGAGRTTKAIPARPTRDLPPSAAPVQRREADLSQRNTTTPWMSHRQDDPFTLVAGCDWDRDVIGKAPSADQPLLQAKSARDLDASAVQAHATAGVTGPGQALPHQAAIQAAFGDHDVSAIRAHVGGAAADASTAIGAEAYATGDAVAFRDQPDLHLAAHEAAHVVQQRAGVHLKGGVGQVGDPYERHADAVADRVVAGQSAADLLSQLTPGGGATAAVQKKGWPEDGDDGRGIAKLRSHQPTAKQEDPGFVSLPAWAGMTIWEFTPGNLLDHLASIRTGVKARSMAELSRGWQEHLEAGHSTKSVTQGNVVAEVKAGYKNAVARGNNTYYADLTWRIAFIELDSDGAGGSEVASEQVQVEEGGRIVFTTAGPVDIETGPSARRPDALAIDPSTGADQSQGRITCDGDDGAPDDQCFLSPGERANTRVRASDAVSAALQNFVRACDQSRDAIKAAQAADEAFVYGLAEVALGFGFTAIVKVGAKAVVGAAAGKAPVLGGIGPDAIGDWADRAGAHDRLTSKGPDVLAAVASLGVDTAKDLIIEAVRPGANSQLDVVASLKRGADKAFLQIAGTLDARTDEELFAIKSAFAAGSQEAYATQLATFLSKYSAQVATLGEYDAHYAQDFAERVAWMKVPGSGRRGLARIRVEITDRGDGAGRPDADKPPRFLGWVDDEMVPFALDRHQRLFGAVEEFGAVP